MTHFQHKVLEDGTRFTLCSKVSQDSVVMGIAITGSRDQFSKKKGRIISEGRMKSKGPKGQAVFVVEGYDRDAYTDHELIIDMTNIYIVTDGMDSRGLKEIFEL